LASVAAAIAASILFAPIIAVGWCSDSDETGTSLCDSAQRSLLGFDTNAWIWLGIVGLIVVGTAVAVRSASRRR
jgi:disulfide bond formation protein DsbB